MSEIDDELLHRLAESVTDGEPIDWDAASSSNEELQRRLRRLRILESIGSASGMPHDAAPMPRATREGTQPPSAERWGHLEIHEKIGEGVFGDVYRAWETTLERRVAVKFLRLGSGSTPFAAHVLQEGRTMARVRHPNVITIYGAEELDGRVGFWMEYIQGGTLEETLEKQGALGSREAAMIGIDVCRALAAVHRAGLVHRDVKTRNVMREDGGRIVLMDFGTGVELQPGGRMRAFASAGTPVYQAPEILRGEPASPRSDLFSLGVLLYRLVTRSYPVEAESFDQLRDAYTAGKLRLLRDVRPDLPAAFSRAVERALAIDPAQRFATAGDMERALEAMLAADRGAVPPTAVHAGAGEQPAGATTPSGPRSPRFRPGRFAGILVVALALGAGAVALVTQRARVGNLDRGRERIPVAVADFLNATTEPDLDGLAGMLTTSLEQSERLSVLTRSRMGDILAQLGRDRGQSIDEDVGREICRQAHVRQLFIPSIRKFGDLYTIDLVVLDAARNEYTFTTREQARSRDRIPAMIDAISASARAELVARPPEGRTLVASIAQITTPNLEAYGHYYAGERHVEQLQMHNARDEFQKAVAVDSTFGLAYARLAYADWWLSDFDSQSKHLKKALALMDRIPEKERFQVRAQNALAEKQGLEAARSILFEMEKAYPDDKEMLYDIGDLSSHLSEYDLAVRYLHKVADADPRFERALQHLARTYRDLGRGPESFEWAKRYAAVDQSWETADLLGGATIATGDFDTGLKVLIEARAAYPRRALELTKSIASAHLVRGEFHDADTAWNMIFEADLPAGDRREAYHYLGFEQAHQGRYREALANLDKAIAVSSRAAPGIYTAVLHSDRALLWLLGWNDASAARREFDACSGLETSITYADTYFEYWPYWGRLFKLYLATGEVERARELAERKFTMDAWFRPYVQAYLQCATGDCEGAGTTADHVLQWGPASENLELLYTLSAGCLAQGRLAQAEAHLLRVRSLHSNLTAGSPYVAKGLFLLGKVHEARSAIDLARSDYSSFIELWGHADDDLPDLREAKARLARLAGQPAGR